MARSPRELDSFKQERAVERALQGVMNLNATLAEVGGIGGPSGITVVDEGFPGTDNTAARGEWLCGDPVGSKPT